jgi:two-component system, NarL family, nitrate/nitrite response regulator NarL
MNEQIDVHPIRLVILDQLGLFRVSLGRLLASEQGFEVAGECATPAEALAILARVPIDLILLDFDVCTEHGGDFISAARAAGYQGRFLIVAGSLDARKSALALKLGASGIFLKSEAPDRLLHAIRVVYEGEVWIDHRVVQLLADELIDRYPKLDGNFNGSPLDDRERQVLTGIVGGLSNRKIGDKMGLSESSVKNVVQRLFSKAGVKTRSQLVRIALAESLSEAGKMREPVEIGARETRQSHD